MVILNNFPGRSKVGNWNITSYCIEILLHIANTKIIAIVSIGKDEEKLEYIAGEKVKWHTYCEKYFDCSSKSYSITIKPSNSTMFVPKRNENMFHTKHAGEC